MKYEVLSLTFLSICIFVGLGVKFADNPRRFEKKIDKFLNKLFK